jgi:electron transfer flavoprotein-quinone oxidoreductase
MLDRFKRHPAIAPLIAGGETIEYAAHLIPELNVDRLPQVYADGVVVVGDAAGLLNPVNREGANLSMLSGKLAADTIIEAKAKGDFSARMLSEYKNRLDESIILSDMKKVAKMTPFAHDRPHLFTDYPQLAASAALEYLTVDGISKKEKQKKIASMVKGLPKRRLIGDALGALKTQR